MNSTNIQEVISISSGLSKAAIRFWPATLVSWLIGFVLLGSLDLAVAGTEPGRKPGSQPTVVILNSYHPGEAWTDNELAGLVPTLRRADPDLVPMIRTRQTCGCPVCTMRRDANETEPDPEPSKL